MSEWNWSAPGFWTFWKTPDGSNITEARATPRGRIEVRTDSGKTYIVPKRHMKKLFGVGNCKT